MMVAVEPVESDLSPGADSLYFIFGGIAQNIAIPRFEFFNTTRNIPGHKIFFRDPYQCWYQNGLPGIGHNVYEVAAYISDQIDRLQPQRVCFVGYSMGGFAAILFAALTGCGEAIAFSAQTSVDPIFLLRNHDHRYKRQFINTYRFSLLKRKAWDLRKVLITCDCHPKVTLFASKQHNFDYIHARHLDEIPNVKIHLFSSDRHDLVRMFRDEGKLPEIFAGRFVS